MFLSQLIDAVAESGHGFDVIDEVYRTVFLEYPSAQAEVYSQPMNTAQDDPWIPDDFADRILADAGIAIEPVA